MIFKRFFFFLKDYFLNWKKLLFEAKPTNTLSNCRVFYKAKSLYNCWPINNTRPFGGWWMRASFYIGENYSLQLFILKIRYEKRRSSIVVWLPMCAFVFLNPMIPTISKLMISTITSQSLAHRLRVKELPQDSSNINGQKNKFLCA